MSETHPEQEVSVEDRVGNLLGLADVEQEIVEEPVEHEEGPEAILDEDIEESEDPPLDAPSHWSDSDREVFSTQPREVQEVWLRRDKEREADYTKKTKTAAEIRKEAEALRQSYQERQKELDQLTEEHEALMAINYQIRTYQNVDWNKLAEDDPLEFNKHQLQYSRLERAATGLKESIDGKKKKFLEDSQIERSQRVEKTLEELSRDIKGWGPELHNKLDNYGKNFGFTENELKEVMDAKWVKILHKAYEYDRLKSKPVKELPKVAKPQAAKVVDDKAKAQATLKRLRESGGRDESAIGSLIDKYL